MMPLSGNWPGISVGDANCLPMHTAPTIQQASTVGLSLNIYLHLERFQKGSRKITPRRSKILSWAIWGRIARHHAEGPAAKAPLFDRHSREKGPAGKTHHNLPTQEEMLHLFLPSSHSLQWVLHNRTFQRPGCRGVWGGWLKRAIG